MTEQASKRISGDLGAAGHNIGEMSKTTTGQNSETINEARGRLASAVEAAKATCVKLEQATAAAAKATDRCVREHPYETIGVAFGLGLLIGVLLSRR